MVVRYLPRHAAEDNVRCFDNVADHSNGSATRGAVFCPTADALYDAWGSARLIDPATNTAAGSDPQLGDVPAGSAGGIDATYSRRSTTATSRPRERSPHRAAGSSPNTSTRVRTSGPSSPAARWPLARTELVTPGGWISLATQ